MNTMLKVGLILAVAVWVPEPSVTGGALAAQSSPSEPFRPHPEATRAISELKSPFCPGRMLSNCPSPYAEALRDSIQVLASAGWSSERLVDWVLDEHGQEWRARPEATGTGLFAWLMPPLVLLAGLALVLALVIRRRGVPAQFSIPVTPLGEREREVLDVAIREMEAQEEEWF